MAAYVKFNDFVEQLIKGNHDFDAHVFKIALTDTLPTTDQVSFDTAVAHPAPAAVNGYTAGSSVTEVTASETGGVTTLQGTQVTFIGGAGGLGPFRYAILYNDSMVAPAPIDGLIAFWDYGSSITLNETETFTIKFNNTSPGTIFTLS